MGDIMTNKTLYNLETEWRLQEDADNGFYYWWRVQYSDVDVDAFEGKERSLMERLYAIGKRWL